MKITELKLFNYRNYPKIELFFSENLNILLGENAQGKTNLLESIYVLAMTKSHRTNQEKELIKWQEDFAKIVGQVEKKQKKIELEMIISNKGKKTKHNHIEQARLSDYLGALNVVLFAPEDLYLIKGSPQNRRRFIDMELGQINPFYLHHLSTYQKILKQRNRYLKETRSKKKFDEMFLLILSEQLAAAGSHVLSSRYRFLEELENWSTIIHQGISDERESLTLLYEPSLEINKKLTREEIEVIFLDTLKKNKQQELQRQTTFVGPHRDDLAFFVNEKNVQVYGSQGQQRTAALSLKLAEIELIKAATGEYPVLLLDDVMSELDNERQLHLLKTIENKVQTFITTTNLEKILEKLTKKPTIFKIRQGQVEREDN